LWTGATASNMSSIDEGVADLRGTKFWPFPTHCYTTFPHARTLSA